MMIRPGEKGPNTPKLLGTSAYPLRFPTYVLSQLDADHLSNECKRRKLKCSGGPTCVRCSRDHIPCVYAHRPSTTSIQGPDVNDEGYVSQIPSHIQSLLSIDQEVCTHSIQSQYQIPGCGKATGDSAAGNADPFRPRP